MECTLIHIFKEKKEENKKFRLFLKNITSCLNIHHIFGKDISLLHQYESTTLYFNRFIRKTILRKIHNEK